MSLGSDRSGYSIWRDIVPIVVFALVLFITFSTRQYSDMQPNLLPTHGSIGRQHVTTYQRERTEGPIPRWTTLGTAIGVLITAVRPASRRDPEAAALSPPIGAAAV